MKNLSILWAAATLFSVAACNLPSHQKVKELHGSSAVLGQQTGKLLEQLVQQRNSINIQGRALTAKEMAFSDSVYALEAAYHAWLGDFEKTNRKKKNKKRLAAEQSLHDTARDLNKTAEELARKGAAPSDN